VSRNCTVYPASQLDQLLTLSGYRSGLTDLTLTYCSILLCWTFAFASELPAAQCATTSLSDYGSNPTSLSGCWHLKLFELLTNKIDGTRT
jgi:hypothetical protein